MLGSRRWPLLFLLVVLALPPLAAVVALPGEKQLKNLVGIDTSEGCGPIRNVGPESAWRQEPDTPILRDGPSSATIAGAIYIVGGISEFRDDFRFAASEDRVERFDPRSGEWTRLPNLPRRLNHVNLAAVGHTLLALGGHTEDFDAGAATGESFAYDTRARRWTRIAEMPTPRGGAGTAVIGDRVYVVGGKRGHASLSAVESYDVSEDRWRAHADMPSRRDHHAVAAGEDGRIYAAGGRQENEVSMRTVEIYDPREDTWTAGPDLPEPKAGFGMVRTPAGVVVAGGEDISRWTLYGGVYALKPGARRWRTLPSMSHPRHGHGMEYVEGRLFVIGGSRCSGYFPEPESYSLPIT